MLGKLQIWLDICVEVPGLGVSRFFTGIGVNRRCVVFSGCDWVLFRSHFPPLRPRALGCWSDNNLLSTPVCNVNAPSPRCLIYTGSSLFMGRIWSINSCFTKLENKSTKRLYGFLRSGKSKSWMSTHVSYWWLGWVAQCHLPSGSVCWGQLAYSLAFKRGGMHPSYHLREMWKCPILRPL